MADGKERIMRTNVVQTTKQEERTTRRNGRRRQDLGKPGFCIRRPSERRKTWTWTEEGRMHDGRTRRLANVRLTAIQLVPSNVTQGMPFKYYHGKTGVVWNVTKRAVGVEVNKLVRGMLLRDSIDSRWDAGAFGHSNDR
mmetsp:Transcript_7669/g.47354  ORF Transcript_7669/g.47354 Transcript_7669/m.47354 type:complete len:139 (+) Transcript_7669:273-689(+)